MDNYSEFCREAIEEKLERESNEQYLKNKRQELQDSIKKLDQKLKAKKDGSSKIQAILDFGYQSYKTDWVMLQDDEQCAKIQSCVMPKLEDAGGSKYSILDVLKIFRKRRVEEGEIE